MPARVPVPKVIMTVFKQTLGEDIDCVNRVYHQYTGAAPTDAQLNTACTSLFADWTADVAPLLTTQNTLTEISMEDLTSDTSAVGTATGAVPGGHAEVGLSAGAALVISNKIARRYRGGHSRTYLAGHPAAGLTDDQKWTAGQIAAWASAWPEMMSDVSTAIAVFGTSAIQVNISYFAGFTNHTFPSGRVRPIPTPRVTPLVDVIIGYVVNPKVGSQRRRNQQSA